MRRLGLHPAAAALQAVRHRAGRRAGRHLRALPRPARGAVPGKPPAARRARDDRARGRSRCGAIASGCRSRASRSLSLDTGFTPLVDAPRLADRARRRARVGEERRRVASDAVVQGSRRRDGDQCRRGVRPRHDWLRVDRQPRQRRRGACGARRARVVDLHPRGSRAGQDHRARRCTGRISCAIRGHYDDVNRLCAQLADRFGWGIVNVNLRGYYGEGSKTMAFEIAEQLGWRLPTAVVAPMAGGSLVTKLRKGFGEFIDAGLVDGALAAHLRHAGLGLRADRAARRARRRHASCRRCPRPSRARSPSATRPTGSFAAKAIARVGRLGSGGERRRARRRASGCSPRRRASSPRRRAA